MKIYLATWLLEPAQGMALTKIKARSRLVSYYHTKDKQQDFPEYLQTGKVEKR